MKALKFLRIFGHLIVNLHLDLKLFLKLKPKRIGIQYLIEYGSNSIIELSLHFLFDFPQFFDLMHPFTKVLILRMEWCSTKNESHIRTIFPNIQCLKLGIHLFNHDSTMNFCLPALKEFSFDLNQELECKGWPIFYSQINLIVDFIRLNPQIEKFEFQHTCPSTPDANFIQLIRDLLPNLKYLYLRVGHMFYRGLEHPFHLENIEHFSFAYSLTRIPFSFSKLKHLELYLCFEPYHYDIDFDHPPVRVLIESNQCLKSILIESDQFYNTESFFELNNVVTNVEDISIRFLNSLPAEGVWRFLKRNKSLKRFSLIGKPSAFYELIDKIVSNNPKIGIRKRILQFTMERDSDRTPTKYVIRRLKWRYNTMKADQEFIQLCTYDVFQSTSAEENYHYIDAVTKLCKRIGHTLI